MTAICRACLAVDMKMYFLEDNVLELYEKLTKVKVKKHGPQAVCYICHYLLLKCYRFSEMANNAENILKDLHKKGFEPSNENMLEQNPIIHNISASCTQSVSVSDSDVTATEIKTEPESCYIEFDLQEDMRRDMEEPECAESTDNQFVPEKHKTIRKSKRRKGRVAVRKKGSHTGDMMQRALELVKTGVSVRQASKQCNLSYTTLRRYVAICKTNPNARLTPNYEANAVFTAEEEIVLVEHVKEISQMFYGLTSKGIRIIAYQMARRHNKKIPPSWTPVQIAGIEWFRSFRRRNPEVPLRQQMPSTDGNIDFYKNLKAVLSKGCFDGRVFYLDEISLGLDKVNSRNGTMCYIVSTTGTILPPVLVLNEEFQPDILRSSPPHTLVLQSLGSSEDFLNIMKHFIYHISASDCNPSVLIFDNHVSHLSIEALDLAKSSGVTVITMDTKHKPLDDINTTFNERYNRAVDGWLQTNTEVMAMYNIVECIFQTFRKSITSDSVVNLFRQYGI